MHHERSRPRRQWLPGTSSQAAIEWAWSSALQGSPLRYADWTGREAEEPGLGEGFPPGFRELRWSSDFPPPGKGRRAQAADLRQSHRICENKIMVYELAVQKEPKDNQGRHQEQI
ncbi:uncharacterized protein LOC143271173 [Peromyscus maniculatus bairdii]|uniref:uncharacterized protein LOC143271173 n=1 Tax=Peromyscus maniculatus bairdii TaxID=230844 RepID=UPI003FD1C322